MDAIDGVPTTPTSPRASSTYLDLPPGSPPSGGLPSFSITQHALQHELDQLRSLRRRSLSAGSGTAPVEGVIDPDLPGPSPPSPTSPPLAEHTDDDVAMPLSDLMWLPARLHPEIAPNEFRNFLRERAAAAVETAQQGEGAAHRQPSGKVRRQKSMLSRQVDPSAPATEDDAPPLPMERQRSRGASGPVDSLTISDLQRLELAAQNGDSEKQLHELLQRSLSRDGAPIAVSDSPDAPLVPHAPGSILRRTARTKIRKPSLAGDGGGHRFGPSKRGPRASATESDAGSSEQDHDAEAAIVDAYTQASPIEAPTDTPFPPRTPSPTIIPLPKQPAPIAPVPILPPFQPAAGPSRAPPPAPAPLGLPERGQRDVQIEHASSSAHSVPPPLPSRPESPTPSVKEKEKRSKWSKLGLRSAEHDAAKRDKRAHKAAASVDEPAPPRSESSSGFLGLFKRKHEAREEHATPPPAPVALSPTASGMLDPITGTYTNFYRLPIHVERAVYRLSHIKLANPRRPLYEQVLISNCVSTLIQIWLTSQ